MKHAFRSEGEAFRLRPICDEDAEFVVALRTRDERARFLNRISLSTESQLKWLSAYYQRENDYYFVIERRGDASPEGLISLYDVNSQARQAEWGRWIVAPTSLSAVESVVLLMDFAFGTLSLSGVYSHTIAENTAVNSFHDSCGFRRGESQLGRFKIGDHVHDAIRHECTASEWIKVRTALAAKALRIAQRVNSHAARS